MSIRAQSQTKAIKDHNTRRADRAGPAFNFLGFAGNMLITSLVGDDE